MILVASLLLAVQISSLAKASTSPYVGELVPPPLSPPVPPIDEPPAIPDSPFIENVASKYPYLIMLTEAFCSRPGDYKWNPSVDLNGDLVINMRDIVMVLVDPAYSVHIAR